MHLVYLSLGSNIDPENHLRKGLMELESRYHRVRSSSVYRSAAVGFEGPAFLNLVAAIETSVELSALSHQLRELEYRYGRPNNASKFSSRHLDIDILTFDDLHGIVDGLQLPRAEILTQSYVLQPFAELAPDYVLPGEGMTMSALVAAHSDAGPPLQRIAWSTSLEQAI